jgi:hypothetical protein
MHFASKQKKKQYVLIESKVHVCKNSCFIIKQGEREREVLSDFAFGACTTTQFIEH